MGRALKGWQRLRAWGWGLLAVGLVMWCGGFLARSWAADDTDFDRYVGWSNIFGFVVGALGLTLVALDRWVAAYRVDLSPTALEASEQLLADQVLAVEGRARARLLGTDEPDTTKINVGFYRTMVRYVYQTAGGERTGTLETIQDYYTGLAPGRLVILGDPGSGKTVLALHLLVALLEERRQQSPAAAGPVPVRFALAGYDTDQPLTEWLAGQLTDRFGLHPALATTLVDTGRVLPVLDGLDEMDPDTGTPERAIAAVARLNAPTGPGRLPLVVTCRSHRHDQLNMATKPIALREATPVLIQPLTAEQAARYLRAQIRHDAEHDAWTDLISALEQEPDETVASGLLRVLDTPWRLTLAVTASRDGLDPARLLPSAGEAPERHLDRVRTLLFDRFVPALIRLHPRPGTNPADPLEPARVTGWLRVIAAHLAVQEAAGRAGTDIVLHRWWTIAGPDRPRRWQAVLNVAILLAALAAAGRIILGSSAVWVDDIRYSTASFPRLPGQQLVAGVWILVTIATLLWWFAQVGLDRADPVPARINLRQLRTHRGCRMIAFDLAGGLAVGLALGLMGGLRYGLAGGLALGLALGLMLGLTFGLAGGLDPGTAGSLGPRDIIRNDLAGGLTLGLAGGLTFGLTYGLTFGLAAGLATGLAVGLTFGLAGRLKGGFTDVFTEMLKSGLPFQTRAAVRYGIAVVLAATRPQNRLPLRFGAFCDWATDAGLFRIAGIAYQFRHRELQTWLTPTRVDPDPAASAAGPAAPGSRPIGEPPTNTDQDSHGDSATRPDAVS